MDQQYIVFGALPPEGKYPTVTAALTVCQDHARPLGYAVILRSSRRVKGEQRKAYFACDCHGKYQDRTTECAKPRKKKTADEDGNKLLGRSLADITITSF
jgi:hypothetical protein